MSCDIFIRTYWKDVVWLELCLAAIARHARGFRSVIVVVPRSSAPWLRRLPLAGEVRVELTNDYQDDYLGQQATKLAADTFTDADFICHVDADCMFARRTTPDDLTPGGKPCVAMTPYALLGRHWPWQRPTETFLGWPVTHDFMRRPPFTYPRWLYAELRAHCRDVHGTDLTTYITTRPPRGFSEFNALGAFAFARHPERFAWIDDSVADPGEPHCHWYWSWGGLDAATRRQIEASQVER